MAVAKLTQSYVDKLPHAPVGKTVWHHDSALAGFSLAVGSSTKSWYVRVDRAGRTMRRKLARVAELPAAEARRQAAAMLVELRAGRDPRQPIGATLADAFDAYLERRHIKPSTARQYREAVELHLRDWLRRPIAGLTRAEVEERHRRISRRAPYYGNQVMRVLRAVLNDAGRRGLLDDNPVAAVHFNRERRRETRISDLEAWAKAANALPNPIRRGYHWLVLLTGHRRNEIACLQWLDLDLGDAPTMRINAPKRGAAYVVPLAKPAAEVLRKLRPIAEAVRPGPWVFPAGGRSKHIVEPGEPSLGARIHDARREFVSVGVELGIPLVLVKASIGHAIGSGDVTLGYAVKLDVRDVIERIAAELIARAGVDPAITADC